MEHLIKALIRVQRNLDDSATLIHDLADLAKTERAPLDDHERYRILDYPDADSQHDNLAKISSLSPGELRERAAKEPGKLTNLEIDLLRGRYWLEITPQELNRQVSAEASLLQVSEDHWREVTDELKRARQRLYVEHDEKAIENAHNEWLQRMRNEARTQQKQEVETKLERAQPWVKRLWEEERGERAWGYAVFYDLEVDFHSQEADEIFSRRDAMLTWARNAVGISSTIGAKWRWQILEWPKAQSTDVVAGMDKNKKSEQLREEFKSLRDQHVEHQSAASNRAATRGLEDGVLSNIFLYIDQDSMRSISTNAHCVDAMWVWAVDPDYRPTTPSELISGPQTYKGCMKVRLQQLVNSLFEARRFHADEYSMPTLWNAAQHSWNQAFVSLNEADFQSWKLSRDVGSALRP